MQRGLEIRFRLATILAAHWDEFVKAHHRWIRPVVFETVRKLLSCQTPALGCHLYRCACGEMRIVPHSCKSRFCPRCGKLATDRWADGVLNELLNVPYHHLVFSVPWQLRSVVGFNRWESLNLMLKAAYASLEQWAREQKGMRHGVVAVIHTFGSDLKWHPHLHFLVTEGGLSLDGKRWIQPYKQGWLRCEAGLKKMWRYHCITMFRQAHREKRLRFPGNCRFLKIFPCFNKMLSKLYDLTWYVHVGACLRDPASTVRYIGRYTKRAVLAEYRLTHYDGRTVRFRYKDYAAGGKASYKTLPVLAFIGRLIRHIPDKHFKMVRYYGLFATRWKARYLEQARQALGHQESALSPEPSKSLLPWRERRQVDTNQDPLLCRVCRRPMKLVSIVFGQHVKIAQLFEEAGVPTRPYELRWQPDTG